MKRKGRLEPLSKCPGCPEPVLGMDGQPYYLLRGPKVPAAAWGMWHVPCALRIRFVRKYVGGPEPAYLEELRRRVTA